MEKIRSEHKAGAVILAAFALFLFILVLAGKLTSFFDRTETLHVLFSDVQGLKKDDPVQVMGLEKGKVSDLRLIEHVDEAGEKVNFVDVVLVVAHEKPFAKSTKVTIDRSMTGNTVVKIEPGRGEPLAPEQVLYGVRALSIEQIGNKIGGMTQRLDDFLAELTDRNLVGSVRALLMNLKKVSEDAVRVSGSLGTMIPQNEARLTGMVKNLSDLTAELAQLMNQNKTKLNEMIQSAQVTTENLAGSSHTVNQLLKQNHQKIEQTLSNVEKSTENMKTLTREARWQPWILLNKPDSTEVKERSVYNSALEFSEGAQSLSHAVRELNLTLSAARGASSGAPANEKDREKYQGLAKEISTRLEAILSLEKKLWTDLNSKK